ncbi:MAG: radical SAM protein [Oscillospiraceae bacterium]|nr:radical SAM protein [Oscillospiraceae bacterium]
MLTKQCNLHCSYCFANEFVNKQSDIMSFEQFEACLRFLSSDPRERIGLIGGEPTLHPDLKRMLGALIDSPFQSVCLFTNGILVDRYFNELRNSKFQILINLNSQEQIGAAHYGKIMDNLDQMINRLYMRDQVGLGLNLYDPNMDFSYMIEVLKRFRQKKLRISVAVPNLEGNRQVDPLAYFKSMKPLVRSLLEQLLEIDVAPNFDCNYIPSCLLEPSDLELFQTYQTTMERSNLNRINPICSPVLDILPDLQVVRCFGMSDLYKVSLMDFQNTEELRRHFLLEVDAPAYHILPNEACAQCRQYLSGKCSCGCYAYRTHRLKALRQTLKEQGIQP